MEGSFCGVGVVRMRSLFRSIDIGTLVATLITRAPKYLQVSNWVLGSKTSFTRSTETMNALPPCSHTYLRLIAFRDMIPKTTR